MSGISTPDGLPAADLVAPSVSRNSAADTLASPRRGAIALGLAVLGFGGLFVAGYLPKRAQRERLEAATNAQTNQVGSVSVVRPKRLARARQLKLPATLEAHEQTVVHARADGYVRRWLVDIGEHVAEHQLLAELDTPELDRTLEQARAHLTQSEAAVSLSRASRDFSRSGSNHIS